MQVLFTTYAYPDDRQAFVERYVRGLVAVGADVCVVASAGKRRRRPDTRSEGPSALRVVNASWEDRRLRKILTMAAAVRGALRYQPRAFRRIVTRLWREHGMSRELVSRLYVLAPVLAQPVDVVHLGWLTAAASSLELAAIDAPVVVSCHGSDLRVDPIHDDGYRARLGTVFARADLVHCVSEDLAGRAIALGAHPDRVFVRSWGADTERFRPGRSTDRARSDARPTIQILGIGRLHWVKGYEYALLALAAVRRAGVSFEYKIIGDGKPRDRRAVLTTIRDLGLEDAVQLMGTRTPDEVAAALQETDLLLMASVSEGMSTVTLEAMAAGVPVIVTDVGGMREAVSDGVEGRVVPPRDPTALAEAVCELARDEELRAAMGRRGRHRAVEAFDSSTTAALMFEQYQRLIERRGDPSPGTRRNGRRALP